jgi:hypothetical protein
LGKLTTAEAEAYEDHYVGCDECVAILLDLAEYVDGMRAAARQLRSKSAR